MTHRSRPACDRPECPETECDLRDCSPSITVTLDDPMAVATRPQDWLPMARAILWGER